MVDVRGDVLRPPHGTTPDAVNSNKSICASLVKFHQLIHEIECT